MSDMPPYDVMDIDDVLQSYDLSVAERLTLKLGTATSDQSTRQHLEPGFSDALRSLRRASVEESTFNARIMGQ